MIYQNTSMFPVPPKNDEGIYDDEDDESIYDDEDDDKKDSKLFAYSKSNQNDSNESWEREGYGISELNEYGINIWEDGGLE